MNKKLQKVYLIPEEFQDYRIKHFIKFKNKFPVIQKIVDDVQLLVDENYCSEGMYIYLYGKNRTFKTSLAVAILNYWINKNQHYTYFTNPNIIMGAKYPEDDRNYVKVDYERLLSEDFILVDDLYRNPSSNKAEMFIGNSLEEFFIGRGNSNKGGIITSKLPLKGGKKSISTVYGNNISSYLQSKCLGQYEISV